MRIQVLLRPTIARFAPSAASASAAANPIPLVAPVIRICLAFTAQQSKDADDLFDGQGPSTRPTTDQWTVRTGAQGARRRRGRRQARETTLRSALSSARLP